MARAGALHRPGGELAGDAVPHQPRAQLGELVGGVAPGQEVQHGVVRRARQAGEVWLRAGLRPIRFDLQVLAILDDAGAERPGQRLDNRGRNRSLAVVHWLRAFEQLVARILSRGGGAEEPSWWRRE